MTEAWLPVAFSLLLFMPSSTFHLFDGLPLSSLPEFAALVLLLPVVIGRAVQRSFGRFLAGRAHLALAWYLVIALALSLKVALLFAEPSGFLACYRSPVEAPPAGPCERSFENPLFRSSVTRIDRELNFGSSNWNLSFVNSLRWNIYPWVKGNISRDRLPLSVSWRGRVDSEHPGTAEVTYVGTGVVSLGSSVLALPPSYNGESAARLPLSAGTSALDIQYAFDDGYRTGGHAPGPYATFRLRMIDGAGKPLALRPVAPALGWRIAGGVIDAAILGVTGLLVWFYAWILRRDAWWLVGVAATAVAVHWPGRLRLDEPWVLFAVVVVLMVRIAGRHRARSVVVAYFSLIYLGLFRRSLGSPDLHGVLYRPVGDDWLTYESFGRSILETWSLEGAEPVFYYQPLVRYVSFLSHLLLGDGDTLISVMLHSLLVLSVLWSVAKLRPRMQRRTMWLSLFDMAAVCAVALVLSAPVLTLTRLGASELASWIALPLLVPLLFGSHSTRSWLAGTALLGLSFLARSNQAPALLFLFGLFFIGAVRSNVRAALLAAGLLGVVAVLPATHNLYYGQRFVLSTTTAAIPENLDLPPGRLVRSVWSDGPDGLVALHKMRLMTHLTELKAHLTQNTVLTEIAFHGLQVAWGVALLGMLVAKIPPRQSLLLLTPALYLGVHLVYQIHVYYPRHVVVGYLAMGIVTMAYSAARQEKREPRPTSLLRRGSRRASSIGSSNSSARHQASD